MKAADYREEYLSCRQLTEDALDRYFQAVVPQKKLLEAMRYSLLAGGKRIRPVLLLKFCQAAGGDMDKALPMACAVEMLHTYSLIHDDLPCMDDDVLRRGKPTCHVVYGEYTATLAGDALQASAFRTLLTADFAPDILASAGTVLARAAGEEGICGGQYLDMEAEGRALSIGELTQVHSLKTAAMLKAAAEIGILAAGGKAARDQKEAALRYADAVGLAFQVRDDMLDCTSTTEILGKPVLSDVSRGKSTFVSLIGLDACRTLVQEKTEEALGAIRGKFSDTGFLEWFALWLAGRES